MRQCNLQGVTQRAQQTLPVYSSFTPTFTENEPPSAQRPARPEDMAMPDPGLLPYPPEAPPGLALSPPQPANCRGCCRPAPSSL